MTDDIPKMQCKQCGEPIPTGARLCSHCHSYQDWRGWLPISPIVLALLTALVSLLPNAVSAIKTAICTPKSQATLKFAALDGTTLRVLAINKGDAPAALIHAGIKGEYLAGATKVRLRDDADAIIPPGSRLLTFKIIPLLDEDQFYSRSIEAMQAVYSKKPLPPTLVVISIAQSDGRTSMLSVPISDEEMFQLLRDNADRCSAIDNPNFSNGCIGSGEPEDESAPEHPTNRPN